jgi:hypothetical protein
MISLNNILNDLSQDTINKVIEKSIVAGGKSSKSSKSKSSKSSKSSSSSKSSKSSGSSSSGGHGHYCCCYGGW